MTVMTPGFLPADGLYLGICEFTCPNNIGKMVPGKGDVNRAIIREDGQSLVIEYQEAEGVVQVNAKIGPENLFWGTWKFIKNSSLGRVQLKVVQAKEELKITGRWSDPVAGWEGDYKFVLKKADPSMLSKKR